MESFARDPETVCPVFENSSIPIPITLIASTTVEESSVLTGHCMGHSPDSIVSIARILPKKQKVLLHPYENRLRLSE
jgi:hypothetical protein